MYESDIMTRILAGLDLWIGDINGLSFQQAAGDQLLLRQCRARGFDLLDKQLCRGAAQRFGVLPVGGQLRGHDLRDQVAVIAGHRNIPRNQKSFLPDRLDAADGGEVIREEDRRGALRQCQQLTGRSGAAFRIAVGARHDVGIRHRNPMGGAGAVETDQTLLGALFFMTALVVMFGNTEVIQNLMGGRNVIIGCCMMVGVNAISEMVSSTIITAAVGTALSKAHLIPAVQIVKTDTAA